MVKERLIEFIKYKGLSLSKFEKYVGLSNGYVYNISKGIGSDKLQRILAKFPELNQDWIISGEGEMLKSAPEIASAHGESMKEYETWLLPMDSHGGSLSGIPADGTLLQNCERVISPIKGVDFAISVYGDSMAPEYPSGSRVLIKRINPESFIEWGRTYVLDTCNGVLVKEVLHCQREGYITCHSINPDPKYADFDIPMADVYGMYRVLMVMAAK
jgi:transcriptional regulator with XRE-family HTH domain